MDTLALEVASGLTVRAAAKKLGVSERAAYRASSRPEFRGRVDGLRSEAIAAASGRLSAAMGGAADVLVGLLGDADAKVRLRAAEQIIGLTLKVVEMTSLEARIAELERQNGGLP